MFENLNLDDFWEPLDDYDKENTLSKPFTDEFLQKIEKELGYKLPESYIFLMKNRNGGIPKNTCCPTETSTSWADDHVAITDIMGIGNEVSYSLCGELGSKFWIDEWEYPEIGVAICNCPSAGHDMIFLDYTECGNDGEPKVVHVDQELDFTITHLADNFEEFILMLKSSDDFDL